MFDNVKRENRYKSSNTLFEKPAQRRTVYTVDTHSTGEIMVHLKIYNLSIGAIKTVTLQILSIKMVSGSVTHAEADI